MLSHFKEILEKLLEMFLQCFAFNGPRVPKPTFSNGSGEPSVPTPDLVLIPQRFVEVESVFKKRVSETSNEVVRELWFGLTALVASTTGAVGWKLVWTSLNLEVGKLRSILRLDSGRDFDARNSNGFLDWILKSGAEAIQQSTGVGRLQLLLVSATQILTRAWIWT